MDLLYCYQRVTSLSRFPPYGWKAVTSAQNQAFNSASKALYNNVRSLSLMLSQRGNNFLSLVSVCQVPIMVKHCIVGSKNSQGISFTLMFQEDQTPQLKSLHSWSTASNLIDNLPLTLVTCILTGSAVNLRQTLPHLEFLTARTVMIRASLPKLRQLEAEVVNSKVVLPSLFVLKGSSHDPLNLQLFPNLRSLNSKSVRLEQVLRLKKLRELTVKWEHSDSEVYIWLITVPNNIVLTINSPAHWDFTYHRIDEISVMRTWNSAVSPEMVKIESLKPRVINEDDFQDDDWISDQDSL